MIQIGTVLDGKYEILKKIGQGGMSVVYLAMDIKINKSWAIKQVKKTSVDKNSQIVYQSFISEANLMKKLDHPSLPRIVDIIDDGENISVVMDYIEGEPLNKIIKSNGPQSEEQVIAWAKQLCDVLGYLHNQNPPIIYRDMKPANIMLKPDGNIKLIDFGIAREFKVENSNDTIPLGTHGFAPPEQTLGKCQTDARTDIYSLGVTLFNLLTGCDPRTTQDYDIKHYNESFSGGLEKIINKCTERFPEDRYQSCDELMFALEHYEEYDDIYIKKLKRKLKAFVAVSVLALIMLVSGCGFMIAAKYTNNKDYETLIGISESTDNDTKIESYLEAIDVLPSDVRAYLKLLDVYRESSFGDYESGVFMAAFNKHKSELDKSSEDWLNLNYQIGITYFYTYTGSDSSTRTRILKAYPYFAEIKKSDNKDFEYYDIACSYCNVGNFYELYVQNSTSVKEPTNDDYVMLLNSFNDCINNIDNYNEDDSAYIKLTMYWEIMSVLKDHRVGFAHSEVTEEDLMSILDVINKNTSQLSVTQEKSVNLRNKIIESYEEYSELIKVSYDTVK